MTPLAGCTFAVLDFETTGVDPKTCLPVSACVVTARLTKRGTIVPVVAFNEIINPGIPIPEGATKIHGITDERAAAGMPPDEAAARIAELLAGVDLVVAHNLPYDGTILHRLAPAWLPGAFACTLVLANIVDKYARGKKLSDVCGRRGITFAAHSAVGDCVAVAELLPHLLGEGMKAGSVPMLQTVGDLTDWTIKAGLERDADYARYCAREGKPTPVGYWESFRTAITPF
jgi:DNA polymerase III subunit epsilon